MTKLAITAVLLAAVGCYAQQPATAPVRSGSELPTQTAAASKQSTITIPAGTKLLLSLVRPVSTRTTKLGEKIYLQTSAPVVIGGEIAIPTGSFLEGSLARRPRAYWVKRRGEIDLGNASLVFANGYTVGVPGEVAVTANLEQTTSTYGESYTPAVLAGLAGAVGGMAIGALASGGGSASTSPQGFPSGPPAAFSRTSGAVIGGTIGGTIGFVAGLILAAHHGGIFLDVGTPVATVLEGQVILEEDRAQAAAREASPSPIRPAPRHYCYEPGSPGSPDTVIPGTQPTVIRGAGGSPDTIIPGTPDMVIPGTPATPGQYYPCPPG